MARGSAAKRRQRPHRGTRERRPGVLGRFDGVPVYDGTVVDTICFVDDRTGERDTQVVLGVGPAGGRPVGYVLLCPCEGVRGLVGDLQLVGAAAAEHHPPHAA